MNLAAMRSCKVLICVGSGGVGKTTVAASLGVLSAQRGLKTLVLTIDPSQRLAQALGMDAQKEIVEIAGFDGRLSASVIDHKSVFDGFIRRAALKKESIEKILQNKLYQQLSTSLSGSQEFTSLEKLYECYESGHYDLIILDTPPAHHAIDFLKAPEKLSALFNEGVAQWFRDPKGQKASLLAKLINTGTRQVLKALEILTGADFIKELSDFFNLIENWQGVLFERTKKYHQLLVSPTTHFALVTSFEEAKLVETQIFSHEIRKQGYQLKYVYLNRSQPEWEFTNFDRSLVSNEDYAELQRLIEVWKKYYENRKKLFSQFRQEISPEIQSFQLIEFIQPISQVEGLKIFAKNIEEASDGK